MSETFRTSGTRPSAASATISAIRRWRASVRRSKRAVVPRTQRPWTPALIWNSTSRARRGLVERAVELQRGGQGRDDAVQSREVHRVACLGGRVESGNRSGKSSMARAGARRNPTRPERDSADRGRPRRPPRIGLTWPRFRPNPPIRAVGPVFGDDPLATRPKPKSDETRIGEPGRRARGRATPDRDRERRRDPGPSNGRVARR